MFLHDLKLFLKALHEARHVNIFVNTDVDALNAYYILSYILKCEHITYSMNPVVGRTDLVAAIAEHAKELKCAVLINCGATLKIMEDLEIENDEAVFYVIDSQRPMDLDNVYDQHQVKLVIRPEEKASLQCPEFAEVYQASSSSESESEAEEENEEEGVEAKRKRRHPQSRILKTARLQRWKERRANLLFDYYSDSYTSNSSAVLMYELSLVLSKTTVQLLWCAILGLTSQFWEAKINMDLYTMEGSMGKLRQEVKRLCKPNAALSKDNIAIEWSKE